MSELPFGTSQGVSNCAHVTLKEEIGALFAYPSDDEEVQPL